MSDPTKREIPINPPNAPTAITLWRAMYMQCNLIASGSSGPDEKLLKEQNKDVTPSEIKRMKEATKQ
jgi:hypothetical protein